MASCHETVSAGLLPVAMAAELGTYRIALHPNTTDELSYHVQSHLNACHRLDDAHWDDEDECQSNTIRHNTRGSVGRPPSDTSETEG